MSICDLRLEQVDETMSIAMAEVKSAEARHDHGSLVVAHLTVAVTGLLKELIELRQRVDALEGK